MKTYSGGRTRCPQGPIQLPGAQLTPSQQPLYTHVRAPGNQYTGILLDINIVYGVPENFIFA